MVVIPVPTSILPAMSAPPKLGKKRKAEDQPNDQEPEDARPLPANGLVRTSTLLKQVKEDAKDEPMKVRRAFVEAFRKDTEERLRQALKRARLNKRHTLMPADV